jgi:hypothetical protein
MDEPRVIEHTNAYAFASSLAATGKRLHLALANEPLAEGLKAILDPDFPAGPMALLMLCRGLNAIDKAAGQAAVDAMIAMIDEASSGNRALHRRGDYHRCGHRLTTLSARQIDRGAGTKTGPADAGFPDRPLRKTQRKRMRTKLREIKHHHLGSGRQATARDHGGAHSLVASGQTHPSGLPELKNHRALAGHPLCSCACQSPTMPCTPAASRRRRGR